MDLAEAIKRPGKGSKADKGNKRKPIDGIL